MPYEAEGRCHCPEWHLPIPPSEQKETDTTVTGNHTRPLAVMASPSMRSSSSSSGNSSAALLLGRQFKQMQTDKDIPGISCGLVGNSVFDWEIMLMLDEEQDSLYGGE